MFSEDAVVRPAPLPASLILAPSAVYSVAALVQSDSPASLAFQWRLAPADS